MYMLYLMNKQEYTIRQIIYNMASLISAAAKTGQVHANNEIRTLSKIIHKDKLKID